MRHVPWILSFIASLSLSLLGFSASSLAQSPFPTPSSVSEPNTLSVPTEQTAQNDVATTSQAPEQVVAPDGVSNPEEQRLTTVAEPWVPGSSYWGSRGIYRLDSAHPTQEGSFVFSLSGELNYNSNFLTKTGQVDTNLYHSQRLHILWAPILGLETGLSYGLISNTNRTFFDYSIQALGFPIANIKYSYTFLDQFGVGALINAWIPSSLDASSLVPEAIVVTGNLLGTYQIMNALEFTLNLGYTHDRSRFISNKEFEKEKRYAFRITGLENRSSNPKISNKSDTLNVGLGGTGKIAIADFLGLAPFAEVLANLYLNDGKQNIALVNSPLRGTFGVKGYLLENHLLELTLGADIRLLNSSQPDPPKPFPGLPLWNVFGMLSVHLFDHLPPKIIIQGPKPCTADTDCSTGETCNENRCVLTTEVIKEVVKKEETFTISGVVRDVSTGKPIPEATIVIAGYEKTPLTVDYRTGAFNSFPIPAGEGELTLRIVAPNFDPLDQSVAKIAVSGDVTVNVNLQPADKPSMGKIQGVIKNNKSGEVIAEATIFIPAANAKASTDKGGQFSVQVNVGRFDVIISAPGFDTQKKRLVIRDGDTIILNVSLRKSKP